MKVSQRVTDLKSRVSQMLTHGRMDRRMRARTNGRTGSLYRTMLEVGATMKMLPGASFTKPFTTSICRMKFAAQCHELCTTK